MLKNYKSQDGSELVITGGRALDHIRQALFVDNRDGAEEIACAAMMLASSVVYIVERPGRHHHIINTVGELELANAEQIGEATQGFLTNKGRFMCRRSALVLATERKQLIQKTQPTHLLFSEDMW